MIVLQPMSRPWEELAHPALCGSPSFMAETSISWSLTWASEVEPDRHWGVASELAFFRLSRVPGFPAFFFLPCASCAVSAASRSSHQPLLRGHGIGTATPAFYSC